MVQQPPAPGGALTHGFGSLQVSEKGSSASSTSVTNLVGEEGEREEQAEEDRNGRNMKMRLDICGSMGHSVARATVAVSAVEISRRQTRTD